MGPRKDKKKSVTDHLEISLNRNRHLVRGPAHRSVIKEGSEDFNRDWMFFGFRKDNLFILTLIILCFYIYN